MHLCVSGLQGRPRRRHEQVTRGNKTTVRPVARGWQLPRAGWRVGRRGPRPGHLSLDHKPHREWSSRGPMLDHDCTGTQPSPNRRGPQRAVLEPEDHPAVLVATLAGAASLVVPNLASTASGAESGPHLPGGRRPVPGPDRHRHRGRRHRLPPPRHHDRRRRRHRPHPTGGVVWPAPRCPCAPTASGRCPRRPCRHPPPAPTILAARCVYPGFGQFDPVVSCRPDLHGHGRGRGRSTATARPSPPRPAASSPPVHDGQSTCSPTPSPGRPSSDLVGASVGSGTASSGPATSAAPPSTRGAVPGTGA